MGLCGYSMKMDSDRETVLFIITDSLVKSIEQTKLCKVVMCDLSQDVLKHNWQNLITDWQWNLSSREDQSWLKQLGLGVSWRVTSFAMKIEYSNIMQQQLE